MHAAQQHIRDVLGPELEQDIRHLLPSTARWTLDFDADDPDAQTLLFHYPAAMTCRAATSGSWSLTVTGRADTLLEEVTAAVERWPEFAARAGLADDVVEKIQHAHRLDLGG